MIYAVLFTDDRANAAVRELHMPAHLAFLERNGDRIRAAGPLRDARDSSAAGGLWLVEAESLEVIETLYREAPFWSAGLRRAVRVTEWAQVFADGRRLF